MGVLASHREVEFEGNFLSRVRVQLHEVRLHVLRLKHRHRANWNLIQERERLCLGWNVGQDNFTLVGRAAQEGVRFAGLLFWFIGTRKLLVTMDDFNIPFEVKVSFSDEFLVKNHITPSFYRNSTLFVRDEWMVWRWLLRQIEDALNQENLHFTGSAINKVVADEGSSFVKGLEQEVGIVYPELGERNQILEWW